MGKLSSLFIYRHMITPNTVYICNYFDGVMSWTRQNIEQLWHHFPESSSERSSKFFFDILQIRQIYAFP